MYDAEIVFFYLAQFYLFVHYPQGFCIFRGDHDAAGVSVDPVAEGGRE
jgi:hypothetical protein